MGRYFGETFQVEKTGRVNRRNKNCREVRKSLVNLNFIGSESILVCLDHREHRGFWDQKGPVRSRGQITKALKAMERGLDG